MSDLKHLIRWHEAGEALPRALQCCQAVENAPLHWVDRFNHRRPLKPIGNIPPAKVEEQYYALFDDARTAA